MDAMTQKPGRGAHLLDQLLDEGCVLFVADSHYELRQVISRDRNSVRGSSLDSGLLAELKGCFVVDDDLTGAIGWRAGPRSPLTPVLLNDFLGIRGGAHRANANAVANEKGKNLSEKALSLQEEAAREWADELRQNEEATKRRIAENEATE
jgi:hypothetical protein